MVEEACELVIGQMKRKIMPCKDRRRGRNVRSAKFPGCRFGLSSATLSFCVVTMGRPELPVADQCRERQAASWDCVFEIFDIIIVGPGRIA